MFQRNNRVWKIGLVCQASSFVSHQNMWHNKTVLKLQRLKITNWTVSFKIVPNYPNVVFSVSNFNFFSLTWNFAFWQIWECWFQIWTLFFLAVAQMPQVKIPNLSFFNFAQKFAFWKIRGCFKCQSSLFFSNFSLKLLNKATLVPNLRIPVSVYHRTVKRAGITCNSCVMPTSTTMNFFCDFQDFLIFLAKYFWSLINSLYLNLQIYFCKSNVKAKSLRLKFWDIT